MKKTHFIAITIIAVGFLLANYQQALARPSVPTNLSPANGSTVTNLTPKLDWNDVSGAAVYEYYFDYGNIRSTTNQSEFTVPEGKLNANTSYSWRVRACASSSLRDCSSSSSSWRFTTPKLNAPSLVAPANNEKLGNLTPELKWNKVDNAYQYMVRVFDNYNLEVFSQTTRDTNATVTSGKLKRGKNYTWQVGTCGASCSTSAYSGTAWSEKRGFSTQDALAVPRLISPTNYISISTPPVILDWDSALISGGGGGKSSPIVGAYQYSYSINYGSEVLEETLISRATINNIQRGAGYSWKVRSCTNLSATDCGEWSPTWYFYISYSLQGPMVVKTDAPGKYVDSNLRARNEICRNARHDNYQTRDCYKIYDSCFDKSGRRIRYCHITVQTSYMPTNSYNIYFIDPDTGTAYKNLDMVPIGKALKLVIEKPEGEWFMVGGSFDSPPISWVNDAAADYQNAVPVSIDPLYEYTIYANSITHEAHNILTPELGVTATDPLKNGGISIEEVESTGKFEIYQENEDYFVRAIDTSGVGVIQVTIPDAFAYGTIDNLWFSPGRIPGAGQIFYFSLTDDQAPTAVAEISKGVGVRSKSVTNISEGENAQINLYADKSLDPDGWDGEKGVSNEGKCEWTMTDPAGVTVSVGGVIDNPPDPASCNQMNLSQTFTVSGMYTYSLRITDNMGLAATDSVAVDVSSGVLNLKVCISSCDNPVNANPLTETNKLSILVDESSSALKACYNTSSGCTNYNGDVTADSSWDLRSPGDESNVNITGEGTGGVVIEGKKEAKDILIDVLYPGGSDNKDTSFGVDVTTYIPPPPPPTGQPVPWIEVTP